MKIEDFLATLVQGVESIRGTIVVEEDSDTKKMDSGLIPREAAFKWLFFILYHKNLFLKMLQKLVHIGQ